MICNHIMNSENKDRMIDKVIMGSINFFIGVATITIPEIMEQMSPYVGFFSKCLGGITFIVSIIYFTRAAKLQSMKIKDRKEERKRRNQ